LVFVVENQKVMLGTFGPRQEPYTYDAEEDTTPSGIFARGSYSAKLKVNYSSRVIPVNLSYTDQVCV
jgi:Rho GDP-dissociation inhibitor